MYKYLVIDCSALCYANAFTMKGLRTDEMETNIIFGFLNSILFLSEKFKTNEFVFCWDGKESKRTEIFPEYKAKRKANRKNDPETEKMFQVIYNQINRLQKEILPSIGFRNSFCEPGYEADDIIADVVIGYTDCLMVTNDEDMFQMLDYADLWKPIKEELWTAERFHMHYHISPLDWVMVKAIGGCSTDEVPGVGGVAETTAIKYLMGMLKPTSVAYASIKNGKKIIDRNLKLVRLPMNGTPEFEIQRNEFDRNAMKEVAKKYWIESYLSTLGLNRWDNFFNRGPEKCLIQS